MGWNSRFLVTGRLRIIFRAVDAQRDPLEADGEGDEGFVGRGGVAAAHVRDGVGDCTAADSEMMRCFLLGVAFGEESEDPALARVGVTRGLIDG